MANILLFITHKEKGILKFLSRNFARGENIHINYVFLFSYNSDFSWAIKACSELKRGI